MKRLDLNKVLSGVEVQRGAISLFEAAKASMRREDMLSFVWAVFTLEYFGLPGVMGDVCDKDYGAMQFDLERRGFVVTMKNDKTGGFTVRTHMVASINYIGPILDRATKGKIPQADLIGMVISSSVPEPGSSVNVSVIEPVAVID